MFRRIIYFVGALIVCGSAQLDPTIDYNACGNSQTCFGMPSGCVSTKNCHTAVTIVYTAPTYKFQIVTNSGTAYVAVGLSIDNKMGSDSVVECVRETVPRLVFQRLWLSNIQRPFLHF